VSAEAGSAETRESLRDTIAAIVRALDETETPYMLTGSIASSFHGEPRSTLDVDVVIDPDKAQLDRLVSKFEAPGYYVDRDAAREALAERGQFNVIDQPTGWKVDLIIRKDTAYDEKALARRIRGRILGIETNFAAAEDVVISKLAWAFAGESERQLRDIAGIVRVSGPSLDMAYIRRWVRRFGLGTLWRKALELADLTRTDD